MSDFSTHRALIVEDSELMRALLRNVLSVFAFQQVLAVPSADEAKRRIKTDMPDIIITDWLMEGMAGLDFALGVRRAMPEPERRTPIVLCTAYTDEARVLQARDAGVTEILAKPITPARLYDALAGALFRPRKFITERAYVGPDRRRRTIPIDFEDRRGALLLD